MSRLDTALTWFLSFAFESVTDEVVQGMYKDLTKDRMHEIATKEFSSLSEEVRLSLLESLEGISEAYAKANNLEKACLVFEKQLKNFDGSPRGKVRIHRRWQVALQKLVDQRRVCFKRTDDFECETTAQKEFVRTVVGDLLYLRVNHVQKALNDVIKALDIVRKRLESMEKLPGYNPDKVPFQVDQSLVDSTIKSGFKTQPLELKDGESAIPPGNWKAACILGGGMSQVCLYVDVDRNGNVRHRIVRKDTSIDRDCLQDSTRWHGDLRSPASRVPMEYHCQRTLQARPEAVYILPALKCEVDLKRNVYRLYVPYTPYGDLGQLIDSYENNDKLFTEPFLWRVFSALVGAGLIMEQGYINDRPAATENEWLEVVHRDLKPHNIFLDLEPGGTEPFPRFPLPKLADYGLAIQTEHEDSFNPMLYANGAGTRGYLAPEQLPFMDQRTHEPVDAFKLLAHTNVWGVGAIMWCLVHRHIIMHYEQMPYVPTEMTPEYMRGSSFELPKENTKSSNAKNVPPTLMDIIRECMAFSPYDRPTFRQLDARMFKYMQDGRMDSELGGYLWNAAGGAFQEESEEYDVFGIKDKSYKVGLAFDGPAWDKPEKEPDASKTAGVGAGPSLAQRMGQAGIEG